MLIKTLPGLARVGNPNKDKWIYALNVTPLDKMKISELIQRTTDETGCPFDFQELEQRGTHFYILFMFSLNLCVVSQNRKVVTNFSTT